MTEIVLTFLPPLGVILFAQIAERKSWARQLTYIAFFALGAAIFAAGAFLLAPLHSYGPPFDDHPALALTLGVMGLFMALPALTGMWFARHGQAPRVAGFSWASPVHLTAWELLVLFIGSNLVVASIEGVSEIEVAHPLTFIILQNMAFALAALLGVGWGVRRSWREVVRRLGLSRPAMHDFILGVGMALLMLLSTMLVGALVTVIFGDKLSESAGFNQQIIRQLPGIGGVLLMGISTGVGEELLFRGAIQPVAGLWITSFLFAISHIQYLSPAILVIFVLGLLLGYTRDKWGLNAAIWTHIVYNSLVGVFALLAMNFDQLTPGM